MSPREQNCPLLRTTRIEEGDLGWGISIQLPYSPLTFPSPSSQVLWQNEIKNINIINNAIIMLKNSTECLTMCQGAKLLTCMVSFNPITKSMRWEKLSSSFYILRLTGTQYHIQCHTASKWGDLYSVPDRSLPNVFLCIESLFNLEAYWKSKPYITIKEKETRIICHK